MTQSICRRTSVRLQDDPRIGGGGAAVVCRRIAVCLLLALPAGLASCGSGGGGSGGGSSAPAPAASSPPAPGVKWSDFDYASIVPRPKQATRIGGGAAVVVNDYDIAVSSLAGPAFTAADELKTYVDSLYGWDWSPEIKLFQPAMTSYIVIGKRSDPDPNNPIAALLTARGLASPYQGFINSGQAEWYILSVREGGPVLVASEDDAGLFYGVQTLKYLLTRSDDNYGIRQFDIIDWPDFSWRGQHAFNVSGGSLAKDLRLNTANPADMDFASDIIRFCARNKMNFVYCSSGHFINMTPLAAAAVKSKVYDVADEYYTAVVCEFLDAHYDLQKNDVGGAGVDYDVGEGLGATDEPFTFHGSGSYATADVPVDGWLANAGFETDVDDDDIPDGWSLGPGWSYEEGTGEAYPYDAPHDDCVSFHYTDPGLRQEMCTSDWITVHPAGSGQYPQEGDAFALRVCAKLSYGPGDGGDANPKLVVRVVQQRFYGGAWHDAVHSYAARFYPQAYWQKQLKTFRLGDGIGRFRIEMYCDSTQTTDKRIIVDYLGMHRLNSAMIHCVRTGDTWPYDIKVADAAGVPYVEGVDYAIENAQVGAEAVTYFPEKSTTVSTSSPPVNEDLADSFRIRHLGAGSSIGPNETVYVSYSFGAWYGIVHASPKNYRYCPSDPAARAMIDETFAEAILQFGAKYAADNHTEMRLGCDCARCRARTDGVDENWEFFSDDIGKIVATCLNPGAVKPGAQPVDKVLLFDDMFNPWHNGQISAGDGWRSLEDGDYYRWYADGPLGDISWVDGLGNPQGAVKDLADKGYADDIIWLIWRYQARDSYRSPGDRLAGLFAESPTFYASMGYDWIGCTGEADQNIRQWSWLASLPAAPGLGIMGTQWAGWSDSASRLVADYAWTAERCPNPGFELDGIGAAVTDGVPDCWTLGSGWAWVYGGDAGEHSIGEWPRYEGRYFDESHATMSVKLSATDFAGQTGKLQSDKIALPADQGGILQFWAYVETMDDCTATVWVREYDAGDNLIAEHPRAVDGPAGEWQLYARDFVTSAVASYVRIEAGADAPTQGTVKLWLDNLTLRPWYK